MNWELILAFCKIVGSAVVLVTGILGILLETHDETTSPEGRKGRKLNRHGWLFLVLTGVSGFMALAGTWGEIIKNRADDENKQRHEGLVLSNLQSQSTIALKSLGTIQHVVTRFESFKVNVSFDLPLTNAIFADFTRQLLKEDANAIQQTNRAGTKTITSIYLALDENTLASFSKGPPSFRRAAPVFRTLANPAVTLVFDRSNRPPKDISFHFLEGTLSGGFLPGEPWGKFKGSILYSPEQGKLQLRAISKDFPREGWMDREMIASFSGLADAHCFFALANLGATEEEKAILAAMTPTKLVLKLDQHSITLTNFGQFEAAFNEPAFHVQLPGQEHILNSLAGPLDDLFP